MPKRLNDKDRYEQRKRYYTKHRKYNANSRSKWSKTDLQMIIDKPIKDVELSKKLQRSVQAIQIARCNVKKYGFEFYGILN